MKPIPIDPDLFIRNRKRLRKLLPKNALAVFNANDIPATNADGTLIGAPNSDLFYLTGIAQEESILVIAPDAFDDKHREILFLREPNEKVIVWEGYKLSKAEAQKRSGIQNIQWLSEFPSIFRIFMCESEKVLLNTNEHQRASVEVESRDARFIHQCQHQFPLHQYRRLAPLMHQLRVVKSEAEIALIRQACDLTASGLRRVLRFVKPGVNEAEVEAEFAHEFIRNRGVFAYPPIIAGGSNNCILHYIQNDQTCRKGNLVLMDVAAGLGNYMSDLTRTIPVSGRFSPRQKAVYNCAACFPAYAQGLFSRKNHRRLAS